VEKGGVGGEEGVLLNENKIIKKQTKKILRGKE